MCPSLNPAAERMYMEVFNIVYSEIKEELGSTNDEAEQYEP